MIENDCNLLNKYQIKLKISGTILITLLTFLGAFGAFTINSTMQVAKETTEYAAKCQVEKNQNVKNVYKKYFKAINDIMNPALQVMTYLSILFIFIIVCIVPFTLYFFYKVLRI